jgi:hypothetical protein
VKETGIWPRRRNGTGKNNPLISSYYNFIAYRGDFGGWRANKNTISFNISNISG